MTTSAAVEKVRFFCHEVVLVISIVIFGSIHVIVAAWAEIAFLAARRRHQRFAVKEEPTLGTKAQAATTPIAIRTTSTEAAVVTTLRGVHYNRLAFMWAFLCCYCSCSRVSAFVATSSRPTYSSPVGGFNLGSSGGQRLSWFTTSSTSRIAERRKTAPAATTPPTGAVTTTAIMGIPGIRTWLETTFPDALTTMTPPRRLRKSSSSSGQASSLPPKRTRPSSRHDVPAEFDHVLIDLNQFLHQCLRSARTDAHALTLLMMELDHIVTAVARPTQSLVVTMDGPPPVAKLATQRQRRYRTTVRTTAKLQQLQRFRPQLAKRITKQKLDQRQRRLQADIRTLRITAGTAFMDQAMQALQYWAWQRFSSRSKPSNNNGRDDDGVHVSKHEHDYHPLAMDAPHKNITVFLSSSHVPGEGEVKLVEWILHQPRCRKGESIAILSGDSDLVLQGLMLPTAMTTHNVYLLLPDGGVGPRFMALSLWEMTRSWYKRLSFVPGANNKSNSNHQSSNPSLAFPASLPYRRTDLAMLLLLNHGNDYLPGIRGTPKGFSALLTAYRHVLSGFDSTSRTANMSRPVGFFYHLHTLDLNVDFWIAFFSYLVQRFGNLRVPGFDEVQRVNAQQSDSDQLHSSQSLMVFQSFLSMGYLPTPVSFHVVRENTNDDDNNNDNNGELIATPAGRGSGISLRDFMANNDDNQVEEMSGVENNYYSDSVDYDEDDDNEDEVDVEEEDLELVQMSLGVPGSDNFHTFQVWQAKSQSVQCAIVAAKSKLAKMACQELLGVTLDDDDDDDYDANDDGDDHTGGCNPRTSSVGYSWEAKLGAPADVESYLYGILWNVQTYQDGVCADYAYCYGNRQGPTSRMILDYFLEAAQHNKQVVGRTQLAPHKEFSPSLSSGLACLAALPSVVKDLVPKPYCWISDETVESIYSNCMDHVTNVFDMHEFQRLCELQVEVFRNNADFSSSYSDLAAVTSGGQGHRQGKGTSTRAGGADDDNWIVIMRVAKPLSRPTKPPDPHSDHFSPLRPNDRIRVSRIKAVSRPRDRPAWTTDTTIGKQSSFGQDDDDKESRGLQAVSMDLSDPGYFFKKFNSIDEVPYVVAFAQGGKRLKTKNGSTRAPLSVSPAAFHDHGGNTAVSTGPVTLRPAYEFSGQPAPQTKPDAKASQLQMASNSKISLPLVKVPTLRDNVSPLTCLNQLADLRLLPKARWDTFPSRKKANAGQEVELIRLTIATTSAPMNILPKDLILEQSTGVAHCSRGAIKQQLAAQALDALSGSSCSWQQHTFKEFALIIRQRSTKQSITMYRLSLPAASAEVNGNAQNEAESNRSKSTLQVARFVSPHMVEVPKLRDNLSPLACLKQLADLSIIGNLQWTARPLEGEANGIELVQLTVPTTNEARSILPTDLTLEQTRDPHLYSRQVIKQELAARALDAISGRSREWHQLTFKELASTISNRLITSKENAR